MSYTSPINFSNPDKENCERATDLSSPLMLSSPKAHSTPLDSPELSQVRQKAAHKGVRDEKAGRTPLGKKSTNTKSVKVAPLARSAKFVQYKPDEEVNVMQVESPGVRGAFIATVSSPGCTDFVQEEFDTNSLPEQQMSVRSELEEGELQSSDEESSECSDSESKEDFYNIVDLQKDLYYQIMEAIACKESKDVIDEKYQLFQQATFDAFKASDTCATKPLEDPEMYKIRQEVDSRFLKVSKLDWRTVAVVTPVVQDEEVEVDESSMEHHESCRILDETNVRNETPKADLIKTPLYEKTVKTVYRKVEKAETSRAVGFSAILRSSSVKFFHGIAVVFTNGLVVLLIIAYFLHFINN